MSDDESEIIEVWEEEGEEASETQLQTEMAEEAEVVEPEEEEEIQEESDEEVEEPDLFPDEKDDGDVLYEEEEETEHDYYGSMRMALKTIQRGTVRTLKSFGYIFVVFSIWFTLRAIICSTIEDENSRGCAVTLRNLMVKTWAGFKPRWTTVCIHCDVIDGWNRLRWMLPTVRIPQWISSVGRPLGEFLKVLVLISSIYWTRFWGIQTYRAELEDEEGTPTKDRLVGLLTHLKEESLDQLDEFYKYIMVVSASATVFATLLFPLVLKTHLQSMDTEDASIVSWTSVALLELWQLFMLHFKWSSFVADVLFNMGPLLGHTPGDYGFICYLGISVVGTVFIHPLWNVTVWWWSGTVVA